MRTRPRSGRRGCRRRFGAVARHGVCRRVGSRAGETDERFGAHAEPPASGLEDGGRRAAASRAAHARATRVSISGAELAGDGRFVARDRCRTYGEIGVETRVGVPARGLSREWSRGEFARVPRGVRCSRASREAKRSSEHAWNRRTSVLFRRLRDRLTGFHRLEDGANGRCVAVPLLSRHFRARRGERGHPAMPAPPFLVGLSAGASSPPSSGRWRDQRRWRRRGERQGCERKLRRSAPSPFGGCPRSRSRRTRVPSATGAAR